MSPHVWDSGTPVTPPTCTEAGVMTYSCTVCGITKTELVNALGHSFTNYIFNNDATCTEDGTETAVCDRCSETSTRTAVGSKKGHTEDGGTVTKQPTATETGTRTYKCTVCGYVLNNETIPATGIPTTPVTPPYVPSNPTTSVTTPQTPSKEPFIQDDNGKTGWEAISDTILNTPDGGTVTINMNDTTVLPKDIVSQIKGRDIDLVLDMGSGFTWTINGISVTKAKTVDMKVRKASKIPKSVIEEYFGDLETIQIDLSHNGDLGFAAELTVDLGSKYNGMYANSYCYKSRKFEFIDSAEISDGKAKLRFTHASSWLITITDVSVFEDVAAGAGVSADGDPIDFDRAALPGFIGVILILGVGFVYFKRARQK